MRDENEVLERQDAESYIASRLEKERDYYDNRADGYRKRYMSNQTWIIVCGAIIPIVTLLNETFECCPVFKCWHLGSILNAVIAATKADGTSLAIARKCSAAKKCYIETE